MIYNKIYDFCKIRNGGRAYYNSPTSPPPRVIYLKKLLISYNIEFEIDKIINNGITLYNIIIPGKSDKMIMAHHDVFNPNSDNANDNSCSVINAIAAKLLDNSLNVVITDGEEIGGVGAYHAAIKINSGYFGNIKYVLNLELTGIGGDKFFIGVKDVFNSSLANRISNIFKDAPIINPPFNDSYILNNHGIDSCVLTTLPELKHKNNKFIDIFDLKYGDILLDQEILFLSHSMKDSVNNISVRDMKIFVENVLMKILN